MVWTRILFAVCLMIICWCALDPAEAYSTSIAEAGKRLVPCPDKPNCVSSESESEGHFIAPLTFEGPSEKAFTCLKRILTAMMRAKLVSSDDRSIQMEFRTRLGFVDDALFTLDAENRLIHMRSASRVGHWDFGANRRRLEKLRTVFQIQCL